MITRPQMTKATALKSLSAMGRVVMTEDEMWAQAAADEEKYYRKVYWQFVRLLLFGAKRKSEGFDCDNSWIDRILCLVCMLLGRQRKNYSDKKVKSWDFADIAHVNGYSDGYSYGYDGLNFNRNAMLYEIYRESEFTY